MLGGAAPGTFDLLDTPLTPAFEAAYAVLYTFIHSHSLDGLDLDVEQAMSLAGIIRLIDRLKADFGTEFIITMAPVASALVTDDERANLSGFGYEALEVMRGGSISWYNAQFYCGWGDMHSELMYDAIVARGWPARKVVVGLVTSPQNGKGFVPLLILALVLGRLRSRFGEEFGGVMGWEYYNSEPGGEGRPWEWAEFMTKALGRVPLAVAQSEASNEKGVAEQKRVEEFADGEENHREEASLPESFEYFTDGSLEE
jgi:hypothetical protein